MASPASVGTQPGHKQVLRRGKGGKGTQGIFEALLRVTSKHTNNVAIPSRSSMNTGDHSLVDGGARQDHRVPEIVQVRKGNAQRKPYDSSPSLLSRFISIATGAGKKAAPSLQTSHPSSSFPSSSFLFFLLLEVHLLLLLPKAPPSCTGHHWLFVP
jgi:hypothetical protein